MKRLTAILTAALLTLTISLPVLAEPDISETDEPNRTESDTAVSTDTGPDSTVSDNEGSGDTKPDDAVSDDEGSGDEQSGEAAGENDLVSYRIKEADMDISVPPDLIVITRDTKEDDPVFDEISTTKTESDKLLVENDMYFRANTKDMSCSISVVVTETKDTKKVGDLSSLTEESLHALTDQILENKSYSGGTLTEHNNIPFLRFALAVESEDMNVYGFQEYTIVNGKCVRVTYQTTAEPENDPNTGLLDTVMETVRFDNAVIEKEPEKKEPVTYRIEEAGMDITIPSDMAVITRDTKEGDPAFEMNHTTKAESDKNLKENDIYLRANTKDFSCSVTVVMNESEDTQKIGDLSSLSEKNIQKIIDKMQEHNIYTGCARINYNNVLFLSFTISYENEGKKYQGLQEYTVLDGKCIKITYQTMAEEENDPNKAVFGAIMESIRFDGVDIPPPVPKEKKPSVSVSDMDIRLIYLMIASVIGIISLMIMILVGIRYNQSKRDLKEEKPEHDEDDGSSDETEPDDDDTPDNTDDGSTDIFSDTGKRKGPSVEIKPMTYDDVISAKGNFTAADINNSEPPEDENDTAAKADEKTEDKKKHKKEHPVSEQVFFIVDDDSDVPQAPLKWDDIPESILDETARPSLDELKKEELADNESYKKAWEAAKAKRSAQMESSAQQGQTPKKPDAENSKKTAKSGKTSKSSKNGKPKTPVMESTMEIPELKNAPEYVPIIGLAAAAAAVSAVSSKDKKETSSETPDTVTTELPDIPQNEQISASQSVQDIPAAAVSEESSMLAGMISRLQSTNEEVAHDIEQDNSSLADKLLNNGSPITDDNSTEETSAKNDSRDSSIELEILKAADGSLVIGAKDDANGQPVDIEIRDASNFKEDRDKEMAALGFETASENEIYNAWKIESKEKPFIVKSVSELSPEETADESKKTPGDKTESSPAANAQEQPAAGEDSSKKSKNSRSTKTETEKFFEGVKSAAPLEAGGIDPKEKEKQKERDEIMFEKESGIKFEHPLEKQSPIVTMQTPFTRVPCLESVNAEEYHKEYAEMKKTMPKNQFYAQRFSSSNITQPFVETPKPITPSSEPAKEEPAEEKTVNEEPAVSKPAEDVFSNTIDTPSDSTEPVKDEPVSQDDEPIQYYTGYEGSDDPFSVQNPDEELVIKDHKKKSSGSFGSRFKRTFTSFFSNDIPDE